MVHFSRLYGRKTRCGTLTFERNGSFFSLSAQNIIQQQQRWEKKCSTSQLDYVKGYSGCSLYSFCIEYNVRRERSNLPRDLHAFLFHLHFDKWRFHVLLTKEIMRKFESRFFFLFALVLIVLGTEQQCTLVVFLFFHFVDCLVYSWRKTILFLWRRWKRDGCLGYARNLRNGS